MRDGFFDSREFASRDGAPSPYGPMNVKQELVDFLNQLRLRFGKPLILGGVFFVIILHANCN